MNTKAQKIRLGIFVLISASLLIFIVVWFTARQLLEKNDTYYVAFSGVSVSGMEVGSQVKYLGIRVGTIADIAIHPEDVTSILVTLALKPGTPIKEDAQADISSQGITGLKSIEIRGGSNEAARLPPGEFIPAGSSLTDDITGKAEVIAEKAEQVINNLLHLTQPANTEKVVALLDKYQELGENANQAALGVDSLLNENRGDLREVVQAARELTDRLLASSDALDASLQRIDRVVQSDTVDQILGNALAFSNSLKDSRLSSLVEELAIVARHTQELLVKVDEDLNQGSRDLAESQVLLKATLQNLHEASQKINDNPGVLLRGSKTRNSPDEELQP